MRNIAISRVHLDTILPHGNVNPIIKKYGVIVYCFYLKAYK